MVTVSTIVLGIVFFILVNRLFSITYFGLYGIIATIAGSLTAAYFVVSLTLDFIKNHPIWAITVVVIVLGFVVLSKRRSS
ncbi:hypothetical protein [Saccharibacillus kuerlensis]|uniref:Uncharacterized protein n=1 Tax=Saccharibacillus kuerlensis TaxID=459527 RepID=A0ABQ2KWR9_9BACL|nr:hypothetical protein [Saccharibacillus kuerlensis]GGN94999.1 hypothetical protein GCM10010969_10270 [Saccharibacillus kuerlensis]